MDKVPQEVDAAVRAYVNDVRARIPVARAYVYGSAARGEFRAGSDVDVAIFSDYFSDKKFVEAVAFLLGLSRKYREVCIEPVGFSTADLNADTPFVKSILTTGQEIPVS